MLRIELQRAESELKDRCWSPPHGLQQWLQLTHEIENKGYVKKKHAAEKQLQQAREAVSFKRPNRKPVIVFNCPVPQKSHLSAEYQKIERLMIPLLRSVSRCQ